ncbi:NAD-dependent epimerase/dehydratase family protein [Echinicola jeungdonensis]|uniref:NAD-dependent epimerase/dehydratase family protein n=1 Tax=Echinicola jeungdonensis TaxID=709343 RepID=A0ABV5J263_9BACT|nr:NAD-dependent epimerase/dehydratase family protein [Echinicola jeungdonensis]MDN3671109.1 NAD-dependent epimerase/dehydratase family protein [Echinicola jeungdonensis]
MKIKAIITGSTGMVGKAVLLECLDHPEVEKVLVINRSSVDITHPKLQEIIHKDFLNLSPIEESLSGYNACFYCMGISAMGLKEEEYYKITYLMTKTFADTLLNFNPDLIFNYVSGAGTDSSEKGRMMWARVKGKTENMILKHGFKDAYCFRPGIILPEKGIQSKTNWYNTFNLTRPIFPLLKKISLVTTTTKVGKAMINAVLFPSSQKILNNKNINLLAGR